MTDAQAAHYDESYPALDGLSGNSNSNRVDTNTSLLNNNNTGSAANSWSAHTASGHQHQNKLSYIQHIQSLYRQQPQSDPSQNQPQSHDQSQQQQSHQQVLNLVDNNPSAMVAQHHNIQQQQQQPQQLFAANNSLASTNTMQANNFQSQQRAKRPGPPSHPMLSERFCTFKIAPEERRHRDFELEQSRILKEIMQKTNTKIEVTSTKDGALNFCIIGKEYNLPVAKNLVLNDFQQGVTLTVSVPRSIHGRLLGQKGQRLATIQSETQTRITIPKKEEDSDVIKIYGLRSNAEVAARAIEKCAREFAGKTVEKVTVERNYILFITGPFNENLKRWEELGAKVSTSGGLLPSKNDRESGHADEVTFNIIGEINVVNQVKDEICQIYEDKKKKCTTVNIEVKKAQHKYILGAAGQNLRQLFAKTGVSVELPHESESETITLRGERSKMASALSELYTQAHSETDDHFEVESWLHKYLIGPKKTNFLDFKALGVDVKSMDDKIKLHGPPTEIENIMDTFEKEVQQLRKNIIRKDINVEARIHGYIIGRSGATVEQIREESGANVIVPKNDELNELITLEGTPEAVAIAEEKINAIAKRYEASRTLVIDQQLHGFFIGRGGEKIRSIREKFNQVIFLFPDMGSNHNEITIVGPSDEVEECYKYLDELHQQIKENNNQIQVPIKKEVVKYLSDARQAIKRIKLEHKVKIDLFINEAVSPADGQKKNKDEKDASVKALDVKPAEEGKKKGAKNESKTTKGTTKPNGVIEKQPSVTKVRANDEVSGGTNKSASMENHAIIIGRKENIEVAKPKFLKLLEEFATTTEIELKVPPNLREHLGPKTKLYRQLCDDFHNKIIVVFPPAQRQQSANKQQVVSGDEPSTEANGAKENKKVNKEQHGDGNNNPFEVVKIRGPKNVVKKAEKRFEALVTECREKIDKNFTVKFNIDAAVYEKFVLNDRLKLKSIRDSLNVKLHIPDKREGVKQLVCTIVGYEKNVHEAQRQFEKLFKDVAERVEETIEIASQLHPRLIGTQGRAVKKMMDDYKISVKFARPGDPDPNAVTLYGRQQNVNSAKSYMQKIANQFLANRNMATSAGPASNSGGEVTIDDNSSGVSH